MRRFAAAASLTAFLCVSGSAVHGQSANGVFGFMSANGTFRPVLAQMPTTTVQKTVYNGTVVVNFTITLASNIPTTTPIQCFVQVTETGQSASGLFDNYYETIEVLATRSGANAACQVKLPYSWTLADPTNGTVSVSYSVSAINSIINNRSSNNGLFQTFALPKSGTMTTFAAAVEL